MTDAEALEFLKGKLGTYHKVAEALRVSDGVLFHWRTERGISADGRPHVWAMVNDNGGNLSRDWLLERAA